MARTSPKRRPRAPQATREEQILNAAGRLFRRRGFAGTSLRDIAAEGGLLLGSVQYRFATKDAILVALMERAVARVTADVQAATEGAKDPVERLRLALAAHLRALLSGDDAVFVLLYDWRVLEGGARRALVRLGDRYEAFWDAIVDGVAEAGLLRAGVDRKLLRLFGFGAVNWVATWYRPGGSLSPDDIASSFFSTLAFGVLAGRARRRPRRRRRG